MERLALAAVMSALLWAGPSTADDSRADTIVMFAFMQGSANGMTVESRKNAAGYMIDYWKDFARRLPSLSAYDEERLSAELDSDDFERKLRASETRYYAIMSLNWKAEMCLGLVNDLSDVIDKDKSIELYTWMKVMRCYSDQDIPNHIERAGLNISTISFGVIRTEISGSVADSVFSAGSTLASE